MAGESDQSKMITQLFERGDYNAFDLCDDVQFDDICSVTSVLKYYFRSLPNPLLTYELYERFIAAAHIQDATEKTEAMQDLVTELPSEHYHTLKALMLHLHG
jgi:Rho-type GTPase-activating protein 1/2